MSEDDRVYTIVPVEGGFEAVWGLKLPATPIEPVHEWVTDVLEEDGGTRL